MKHFFARQLICKLKEKLWSDFEMLYNVNATHRLACSVETETVWEDCRQFLSRENNYVLEHNLFHLKDDPKIMIDIFRLY